IHTQGCHQMMDEAEKDYKNMSDRIVASVEVMKTSYADFITEAQTSAARGMLILHVFSSHVFAIYFIGCRILMVRQSSCFVRWSQSFLLDDTHRNECIQ
ncbi:hypothetical protein GIB67_010426, partial [Kingdonia uniflora]